MSKSSPGPTPYLARGMNDDAPSHHLQRPSINQSMAPAVPSPLTTRASISREGHNSSGLKSMPPDLGVAGPFCPVQPALSLGGMCRAWLRLYHGWRWSIRIYQLRFPIPTQTPTSLNYLTTYPNQSLSAASPEGSDHPRLDRL